MTDIFHRILRDATEADRRSPQRGQKVFTVDKETRAIVVSSFLDTVLGRCASVVVMNDQDPSAIVTAEPFTVTFDELEEAADVGITVAYQATCAKGDEVRIVEALGAVLAPSVVVREKLCAWVGEYVRTHASLLEDFLTERGALAQELKGKARRDLGLTLLLKLSLAGGQHLAPIVIGPRQIEVRASGATQRFKIEIEARLDVANGMATTALRSAARTAEIVDVLFAVAGRFFETSVSIERVFRELSGLVAKQLQTHLEPIAARYGRTLSMLTLQLRSGALPEESLESKVEIERELPEYPEKIKVTISYLLRLVNIQAYFDSGAPALDDWAKRAFTTATQNTIFAVRYSDLIRNLPKKKDEIRELTAESARKIGYEIRQFVAITNLPFEDPRRAINVTVRETYQTRHIAVTAGLEATISLSIRDITKVEALLDVRTDLQEHMKGFVRERLETVLLDVDPEEFYLYFFKEQPLDADVERGRRAGSRRRPSATLEQHLRRDLTLALNERYGAAVSQVVFKPVETHVTRLIDSLCGKTGKAAVEIRPVGAVVEPFACSLHFRIEGVSPDGWANLLQTPPTVQTVTDTIRLVVEDRLPREYEPSTILYQEGDEVLRAVRQWVIQRTSADHGLHVVVTDFTRSYTDAEQKLIELRVAALHKQYTHYLKELDETETREGMRREHEREMYRGLLNGIKSIEAELQAQIRGDGPDAAKLEQQLRDAEDRAKRYAANPLKALAGGLENLFPFQQQLGAKSEFKKL